MRLARGSGVEGLSAMAERRLVRAQGGDVATLSDAEVTQTAPPPPASQGGSSRFPSHPPASGRRPRRAASFCADDEAPLRRRPVKRRSALRQGQGTRGARPAPASTRPTSPPPRGASHARATHSPPGPAAWPKRSPAPTIWASCASTATGSRTSSATRSSGFSRRGCNGSPARNTGPVPRRSRRCWTVRLQAAAVRSMARRSRSRERISRSFASMPRSRGWTFRGASQPSGTGAGASMGPGWRACAFRALGDAGWGPAAGSEAGGAAPCHRAHDACRFRWRTACRLPRRGLRIGGHGGALHAPWTFPCRAKCALKSRPPSLSYEEAGISMLRSGFLRRLPLGNARNVAFWVILFLLILALFNLFSGGQSQMNERSVAYSDFMQQVESGQVVSATLDGERVQFTTGDGAFSRRSRLRTPTPRRRFWPTASGSRRRRRSSRAS